MATLRTAAMAAVVAAGLLAVPAPVQAASGLPPHPPRGERRCPPEYGDHELGCVIYRLPRRPLVLPHPTAGR